MKAFYRSITVSCLRPGNPFYFDGDSTIYYRGKTLRGTGKVRIYSDPSLSLSSQRIVSASTVVITRCW